MSEYDEVRLALERKWIWEVEKMLATLKAILNLYLLDRAGELQDAILIVGGAVFFIWLFERIRDGRGEKA